MRGIPDQIGVGNGIKTFCLLLDRKELCSDRSPPSPSATLRAFHAAPPHPAFALCAHWQHSIIRPRQLQPARLTTEEFDVPPPPRDTEPLRSSLFLRLPSCSPVGQSSTLSSGAPTYWELIGGRVSFESAESKTTESRSSNMFPDWTLISSPESVPSNLLSFFSFCLR